MTGAEGSAEADCAEGQGLDDHAHRPTLQRLPKDKPVVASPAGAAVAKQMGFHVVHSLDHGQAITMGPLTIRATMGKPRCPLVT